MTSWLHSLLYSESPNWQWMIYIPLAMLFWDVVNAVAKWVRRRSSPKQHTAVSFKTDDGVVMSFKGEIVAEKDVDAMLRAILKYQRHQGRKPTGIG